MGKLRNAMWWMAGLILLALIAWGLSRINLSGGDGHRREQMVKITTLPDTPPPPPPKPPEKPPEPKPDSKPQPQQENKPVQAPAAPAPMKMEGAAGNGPSAFQSGSVTNDYKGGAVNTGPGGGASADDRRRDMFYVNNIKRQLKDALERNLETDAGQMDIEFSLWIDADGRLSRYELVASGNAQADADARRAFDAAAKVLRLDKPGNVPQPLRMRMSLLPAG